MEINIAQLKKPMAWYLDCNRITGMHWPDLYSMLSKSEQKRANKFYFEHDRQSYIAAHALTRSMIGFVTGQPPSEIEFCTCELGKPEIALNDNAPKLRVNLSHTRHMVAVVLMEEHDIGVDIEWLGRADSCLNLAETVFTPEEQAILENCADHQKKEVFLTLWTLKEAYIKAIGKGLSLPLTDFHFSFEPLAIHFKQNHEYAGIHDPNSWVFQHFRLGQEHVAAIGVQGASIDQQDCVIEPAPLSMIADRFFNT